MGKYDYFHKAKTPPKREIHPVWRGIGCLMMIVIPVISWAATLALLEYGKKQAWAFISQLSTPMTFSAIFYQIPLVRNAAMLISATPDLKFKLIFFVLFLLGFTGLFSLLNAVLVGLFSPPRD